MGRIPSNMTEVLFISGHGREYIQTDIHLDNECIVKSRWMFNNDSACIYGSFTSGRTDNFCLYGGSHSSDSYIRFNGQLVRAFRPVSGTTYSFEHGADGFFVDGIKIASFSAVTFTCSVPLRIFGLPNSNYGPISGSCYGFQIIKKKPASELLPEETVVLYDFVPVKNEDTGEAGMYETVNGVFYGNASGKGAFTASTTIIERPIPGKISAFRRRLMEAACEHYEPEPGYDGYIWAYYNITSTTEPTKLVFTTSNITEMIADGNVITRATGYTFSTAGKHFVKLKASAISSQMFNGCNNLIECYIPDNMYTELGYGFFRNAKGLTASTLPSSIVQFNSAGYGYNGCTALKYLNLKSFTTIGAATNIGQCTSLETIILDSIVTLDGSGLFGGNSAGKVLKLIDAGPDLQTIGQQIFYGKSSYLDFIIRATTPPSLNQYAFYGSSMTYKIWVPYSSDHSILNAYKSATNWSTISANIYELNPDGTIPV